MNIRITRIGFEIHPTVGKRAKRMPDATVETTVLSGGSINQINQNI